MRELPHCLHPRVIAHDELQRPPKADPEYASVPIVLMSGVKPSFSRKDYPWDVFLRKPFEIDDVLEALRSALKAKP